MTASKLALLLSRIETDLSESGRRITNPDLRATWTSQLTQAATRVRTYLPVHQHIEADARLSAAGKQAKLADLAAKERGEWGSLETTRGHITDNLTQRRARLYSLPAMPDGNEVVHYLKQQEVRAAIRALPEGQRKVRMADAVKRGDGLIIRAMLEDPYGELNDRAYFDRLQQEHLERTQPAAFQELRALEELKTHLDVLVQLVDQTFGAAGTPA